MTRLRTFLQSEWEAYSDGEALPREAFNRWLMERLNAGGIDPILGGGGDEELLRAAADGLHREILRALRDTSDMSEMSSKVWGTCSRLAAEADAAAVRLQASATQDTPETPRVLATLNAPRACYEFRLETREDRSASENVEPDEHETIRSHVFTISPSALSQLAQPVQVLRVQHQAALLEVTETYRQTDRQTDRQQTDRQTDRRATDRVQLLRSSKSFIGFFWAVGSSYSEAEVHISSQKATMSYHI